MNKENKSESVLDGIPEIQLESLARCLLEPCRKYLASEQGKKDYEEWVKNGHTNHQNIHLS